MQTQHRSSTPLLISNKNRRRESLMNQQKDEYQEALKTSTSLSSARRQSGNAAASSSRKADPVKRELPPDFKPQRLSVICGKGKQYHSHPGNQRFYLTIDTYLPRYMSTTNRQLKSEMIIEIVECIKAANPNGGAFVRKQGSKWIELTDDAAREKVGFTIRETIRQRDPKRRHQKNAYRRVQRDATKQQSTAHQAAASASFLPTLSLSQSSWMQTQSATDIKRSPQNSDDDRKPSGKSRRVSWTFDLDGVTSVGTWDKHHWH